MIIMTIITIYLDDNVYYDIIMYISVAIEFVFLISPFINLFMCFPI